MANNYKGFLLRAGSNVSSNPTFPNRLIIEGGYNSTPNQREEVEAYRDDYTRNLTRVTASGTKSSISITTIDDLTLNDKIEIQTFFNNAMSDTLQRKVRLTFWNDETNAYATSYFYLSDITFTISRATATDIYYKSITIDLTEY